MTAFLAVICCLWSINDVFVGIIHDPEFVEKKKSELFDYQEFRHYISGEDEIRTRGTE